MFDSYKNFLLADRLYTQDRYVLEVWLLCNFIAMVAYYKLYNKLQQANLLSKYSPKDFIEISKSIYKFKIRNDWMLSEVQGQDDSMCVRYSHENATEEPTGRGSFCGSADRR